MVCGDWLWEKPSPFSPTSTEACPWDSANGCNNWLMRAGRTKLYPYNHPHVRRLVATLGWDPAIPHECCQLPASHGATAYWHEICPWSLLGSRITWPGSHKENRSLAWMPDWVVAFLVTKLCHKTYIMCTCTRTESNPVRMFLCMLIVHNDHTSTIHVYIAIVMTPVIALEAWQSSQGHLNILHHHR